MAKWCRVGSDDVESLCLTLPPIMSCVLAALRARLFVPASIQKGLNLFKTLSDYPALSTLQSRGCPVVMALTTISGLTLSKAPYPQLLAYKAPSSGDQSSSVQKIQTMAVSEGHVLNIDASAVPKNVTGGSKYNPVSNQRVTSGVGRGSLFDTDDLDGLGAADRVSIFSGASGRSKTTSHVIKQLEAEEVMEQAKADAAMAEANATLYRDMQDEELRQLEQGGEEGDSLPSLFFILVQRTRRFVKG
eukprot:maker-scaffold640_size121076-snap-gene-0.23 protein:Tk07474 transcript:maker-scaffold640_size121076-snap-gene-0.23-mRNA-1 annotation:"membrane protein"